MNAAISCSFNPLTGVEEGIGGSDEKAGMRNRKLAQWWGAISSLAGRRCCGDAALIKEISEFLRFVCEAIALPMKKTRERRVG